MSPETTRASHTAFWPVCLLALCFGTLTTHQVIFATRQYLDATRLREQQITVMRQAADAEQKMTAMMVDLLLLAKTDAQARAIVDSYRIQYNAPTPQAGAAAPTPALLAMPAAATPTPAPSQPAATTEPPG